MKSNFDNVIKLAKPLPKRPKRPVKPKIGLIRKKLWVECKRIIRAKYGNTCYTCGKSGLVGSQWHTGHFIPSSVGGAVLRYQLMNLRPQCYRCNIDLSGNGAVFYRLMVQREGQAYVDFLFEEKKRTVKDYDHYVTLLEQYRLIR
jgi:hypothetical protein